MLAYIVLLFLFLLYLDESPCEDLTLQVDHSEQQSLFQDLSPPLLTTLNLPSFFPPPTSPAPQEWPPPSQDCPRPEPAISTSRHPHPSQSSSQPQEKPDPISNLSSTQHELQQQPPPSLDAEPSSLLGLMSRSSFPHTFDLSPEPELEHDAHQQLRNELLETCTLPPRARRPRLLVATLPFCSHVPLLVLLPRASAHSMSSNSIRPDELQLIAGDRSTLSGVDLQLHTTAPSSSVSYAAAETKAATPSATVKPVAAAGVAGGEQRLSPPTADLQCVLEAAAERCRECVSAVLARDAEAGAASRAFARALEFFGANAGPLGCANERAELNEWSNGRHTCSDCTVCYGCIPCSSYFRLISIQYST